MTIYIGAVSRHSPANWQLAKSAGLWGVTRARVSTARRVEAGDKFVIWLGGRGFGALCTVTDRSRSPRGVDEAPWDGGLYQWKQVVPFKVDAELDSPLWLPFDGDAQERTGLSKVWFRSSFQPLPDNKGTAIISLILSAKAEEEELARLAGAGVTARGGR